MISEIFRKFANVASDLVGSVWAFIVAVSIVLTWALTGPVFGFSDTWQLIINTGTTIVTFLMVFVIQNTQNRDNKATHAKLDELIVHVSGTDTRLAVAEDLSDEQLKRLKSRFEKLANGHRSGRTRSSRKSRHADGAGG